LLRPAEGKSPGGRPERPAEGRRAIVPESARSPPGSSAAGLKSDRLLARGFAKEFRPVLAPFLAPHGTIGFSPQLPALSDSPQCRQLAEDTIPDPYSGYSIHPFPFIHSSRRSVQPAESPRPASP
jgi:hypothetical protein